MRDVEIGWLTMAYLFLPRSQQVIDDVLREHDERLPRLRARRTWLYETAEAFGAFEKWGANWWKESAGWDTQD